MLCLRLVFPIVFVKRQQNLKQTLLVWKLARQVCTAALKACAAKYPSSISVALQGAHNYGKDK